MASVNSFSDEKLNIKWASDKLGYTKESTKIKPSNDGFEIGVGYGQGGLPGSMVFSINCIYNNNRIFIYSLSGSGSGYNSGIMRSMGNTYVYKFKTNLNLNQIKLIKKCLELHFNKFKEGGYSGRYSDKSNDLVISILDDLDILFEKEFLLDKCNDTFKIIEEENKKLKSTKELFKFEQNVECEELKEKYELLNSNYDILEKTNKKLLSVIQNLEKRTKTNKNNVYKEVNVEKLLNNKSQKRSVPKPRIRVRSVSSSKPVVENI